MKQIFGIKLDKLSYSSFLDKILKLNKQNIVFTPNPEILLNAKKDNGFKKTLEKANYLTSDGIGLYLAYQMLEQKNKILSIIFIPYYFFNLFFKKKYLYKKYGDRISGSDLTKDIINKAQNQGIKVFIIDLYNPTDSAKVLSQKSFHSLIKKAFPRLLFEYYIYNPEKKQKIIDIINKSNSKILFSTLGMKKQEESIVEILGKCKNIKLGLAIGSSFDYIVGFQKRAPKIFRLIGIEWLYRLFTGPHKLKRLKRVYNAICIFLYEVIKSQ